MSPNYDREQFLKGLGLTVLTALAMLVGFRFLGNNPPISEGGWYALWGAFGALVVKMLVSDWGLKAFEAHKHGYDMCIMALGTSFSTLAYELSKDPLVRRRVVFLLVLSLFAFVGTLVTGGNSRSIESNTTKVPGMLKWVNIGLGSLAIALNLFFLVVKDQGAIKTQRQQQTLDKSNGSVILSYSKIIYGEGK